MDGGPANGQGDEDADLAVFVDRLAAAGSDRPTALAQAQIRRTIAAGATPPGLRRLAEALAASVAELPPPRQPSEDTDTVVAAIRLNALVVLEDFDTAAVSGVVASLLADGRRVVVTARTPGELAAVRDALPADVTDRTLDRLPELTPAELRELRRLLATSTPARRARAGQQLPPDTALPPPAEVAELCAQASRPAGTSAGAWMIPGLLGELDHERRNGVIAVAGHVQRALDALQPRAEQEWAWSLLSDLIYSRHRATFDRMLEDTAKAVAALEQARSAPPVSFTAAPPLGAREVLGRYLEFLGSGGRARSYFRSSVQRDVQPVLEIARVGSRAPESEDDVRRLIEHIELGELLAQVDAGCAETGIPAPRNESELVELTGGLVKVAAAARAVGALRHDVLFIAPNSPLSVPDVESAEQIARAVLEFADHGSAVEAGRRVDAMAADLARRVPAAATAPEHEQAVAALRRRDPAGYAAAIEALGGARRDVRDENRRIALLQRLGSGAPRLADAWTALGESDPVALGLASFVPMEALLSAVPPPDSADVVLVLGAAGLGVERLLLAAVAPRMIAVVGPGPRPEGNPTLLSVLQRASALVIRGGRPGGGRVVPLSAGASRARPAQVGRAGA